MTVVLDGCMMTDRATLHEYLKTQLSLPSYYGKNLDALYDLLTEINTSVKIEIINSAKIKTQLGNYGLSLENTFRDASEENPFLEVEFK